MKGIFFLMAAGICVCLAAQPVTDPGFDPILSNQLQWALVTSASSGNYKNLSTAVYIPGQGTWLGLYNPSPLPPVSTESKFCIASNSKAFVAGLCLRLRDEGLLDLDLPIGDYLPFAHPYIDPAITLRQLLSHQSGLADFYNDASAATLAAYNNVPDSLWSPDDVLATLPPPEFAPGQSYAYSNTNYLVAQIVCTAMACLPAGQLLQDKVFSPLGLLHTVYPGDGLPVFDTPFAPLYSASGNGLLDTSEANGFLSFIQTAGGIWSTPSDMVNWYRTGLFPESISDTSWLSATSYRDLKNIEPWSAYGLGIRARNGDTGGSLYYHAGAWGYRSYAMYDSETGIVVCVLSNKYGQPVGDIAEQLFETALLQLPPKNSDIALDAIIEPKGGYCDAEGMVRLNVRNAGIQPVSQLAIKTVVGDLVGTITQNIPVTLAPGDTTSLVLQDAWWAPPAMDQPLTVEIVDTSGYPFDNKGRSQFNRYGGQGYPVGNQAFMEEFTSTCNAPLQSNWTSYQPENGLDWRISHFAGNGGALCKNNFNDGHIGQSYAFELPPLAAPGNAAASLQLEFHYAYGPYPGYADSLRVEVSADCGQSWTVVWISGGYDLMTSAETTQSFLPGPADWGHTAIDLDGVAAQPFLIRFSVVNGFGNNIWLDNIRVSTTTGTVDAFTRQPVFFFPNPLETVSYLTLPSSVHHATIQVIDVHSQVVFEADQIKGQTIEFNRGDLPGGSYYYFIREKGREIASGVLIIQ